MYKVLIVDDERMIRENMKKVVAWDKLEVNQVQTAASGREALELIGQEAPDIMITDISMTQMTGLELIEKVHGIAPKVRIVVLTGYDSFEYARESLRLHVQDFLLKPIDEEVLFDCIGRLVKGLKEQEQQAQLQRMEGIASQIELESAINRLVHGEDVREALSVIENTLHPRENSGLAAVLLQPRMNLFSSEPDRYLNRQQIYSICLGFIDAKGLGISSVDNKNGRILIVLYVQKCDVEEVIVSLSHILKDEFGCAPKAAIGNEAAGFEKLPISYQEALYLLENDKTDIDTILTTDNNKKRNRMFQEVFEEIKRELCGNVEDYASVLRIYEAFCKMTESYHLSEAFACRCCFELLANVSYAYFQAGGTTENMGLENFMQTVHGFGGPECLELGKSYLVNLLGRKEKDSHEIVTGAKFYINSHLSDDLSVCSIAENFFVSPNYFSRLFKRETGQGCNEYIVQKRMEKAGILLETTNFNTGKIAGMVGYNDTNYFSMAFKKHCGMSPTHYRSKIREEKRIHHEKTDQKEGE